MADLGVELLQERFLGWRHHGVQMRLEELKLLCQEHTAGGQRVLLLDFLMCHLEAAHRAYSRVQLRSGLIHQLKYDSTFHKQIFTRYVIFFSVTHFQVHTKVKNRKV